MLLFGDIHNHCAISYGYGSLENALENGRSQLDFCAVTGHAMWPDMPPRTEETDFIVDFHEKGFAKLRGNYRDSVQTVEKYNEPGKFSTFISYEMHGSKYGDHHIVSGDMSLPLLEAGSPRELYEMTRDYKDTLIIPHHVAYSPGYRGISWEDYDESIMPVVEVCSKHGCSMSEQHPFAYYHTMGGRDGRNTIYHGLAMGKRFGFVGSTDHHAGYPGSYGDCALAVEAKANTRHDIMEAIKARRCYAVTADKIKCAFSVNGHGFGEIVRGEKGKRRISLAAELSDPLDKLVVYKNLKPVHVINGELLPAKGQCRRWKLRLEFGWGSPVGAYPWHFRVRTEGGSIVEVEKCFRGACVLSPVKGVEISEDVNRLGFYADLSDMGELEGYLSTVKNISTTSPSTSAIVLTIDGDADTALMLDVNGRSIFFRLRDVMEYGQTHPMGITNSETVYIHPCLPETLYNVSGELTDEGEGPAFYHMEVFEKNGSMAFVSPVYFE